MNDHSVSRGGPIPPCQTGSDTPQFGDNAGSTWVIEQRDKAGLTWLIGQFSQAVPARPGQGGRVPGALERNQGARGAP